MTPVDLLKRAVALLKKQPCRFALAGGFVAALYRKDIRATDDVDLLFFSELPMKPLIEKLFVELHCKMIPLRIAQLKLAPGMNKKTSPIAILAGIPEQKNNPKLDILLPVFPWFHKALERAQDNRVDFGFDKIPTLTLEDFILSKLNAFQNNPSRFKDLDDLQSVFQAKHTLDLEYLTAEVAQLKLELPKALFSYFPKALQKLR